MSYSQSSVGSLNGPPMPPSSSQQPQPSQSQSQSQSQSHSQSQQSQPQMGSFNASQSTATATSPPRGSQQSAVSYSFTNGFPHGLPNSSHMSHHEDNSGYGALVPYPQDYRPQIYKAVYSNVSVYEMEVNGVAVMKRRSDNWLNATQILKVAGVVKARRTKTLEKEIAAGEHEKVQGGYGKYQGTWVNFQRGVELCREYHVEELLRPLLEYDQGGEKSHDTPTKEQAMAAQRKRLFNAENRAVGPPPQGTFFQNISSTAANAVNAISKARFESPNSRSADNRRPSIARKPSQMSSQESQNMPPTASQQSMYSMASDSGFSTHPYNNGGRQDIIDQNDATEPPRKRFRSESNQGQSFGGMSSYEPTPTEPNDSFYQPLESTSAANAPRNKYAPLPPATQPDRFQKMKLIMTLFLDKRAKDFSNHPAIVQLSGEDLEIPLDEYQNSALHWAAMLARLPLVQALVDKGVSIYRQNAAGETALQKAVGTRNNLDYRTFPKLLQILAPTIDMVDHSGRSILHHIAVMAATGGGGHVSAKHYLEALLEFIVRHGGEQEGGAANGNDADAPKNEVISLGRFVSEIVNLRDDQGDTALNIAGRARSVLVPQLLEVGADPHIPNHTGLRPADYGVGVDMVNGSSQSQSSTEKRDSFIDQLAKTKKEILDATMAQIRTLVEETLGSIDRDLTSELSKKQAEYDHWHSKIRESARARQIEQNHLDALKRRAAERVEIERRIQNLERDSATLTERLAEDKKDTSSSDSESISIGDADRDSGVDVDAFDSLFPSSPSSPDSTTQGFSAEQTAFLSSLPPREVLEARLAAYREHNDSLAAEVERLKSRNVVLGENYRRVVMACTGWSAEQVDEAVEGLTQCVKELNEHPVPEDEALEILMRDRGQDW
ncbi:hypothetical protein VTN49DRAFT_810 [Thermomyces lanuginosus]|uniref:uncharacterized protein n=1 Tax=Thermomyces lanuginosus TaxID=5541 RepID=UPI003743F7C6